MNVNKIQSLGSITPEDIDITISDADLIKEIEQIFVNETGEQTLGDLKRIGGEGKKILTQLIRFNEWFLTVQNKLKSLNKRAISKELENLYIEKQLIYWTQLMKKAYAFVQKTRTYITGEKLEYIIYFDESLSGAKDQRATRGHSQDKVGVFSLEQVLSLVSLDIEHAIKDTAKLRLNRQDNIKALYDNLENMDEWQTKIIKSFEKILKARHQNYVNIKNDNKIPDKEKKEKLKKAFTARGFAVEAAITLLEDTDDVEKLVEQYQQDNEAFWRGGDLQRAVDDIPAALLSKYEQSNFEVKRLSATATNSLGASLATLNGLITALTSIVNIFTNPNLTKAQMEDFIKKFVFKAEKNIRLATAESLENLTAAELDAFFDQWEKQ